MTAPVNVTFRICRYDPASQQPPAWKTSPSRTTHGMTVLDGLRVIKETRAASLAWRSSCRMGVCGSCGMFINGHPRLACNTQITELGTQLVTVAPLPNFDIIRDLVPDLRPMFDAHAALMPHIIRDDVEEMHEPTGESYQTPHELEQFLQFSYCISAAAAWPPARRWPPTRPTRGRCPSPSRTATTWTARDGGFSARKQVLATERGPGSATTRASVPRHARKASIRPGRSS